MLNCISEKVIKKESNNSYDGSTYGGIKSYLTEKFDLSTINKRNSLEKNCEEFLDVNVRKVIEGSKSQRSYYWYYSTNVPVIDGVLYNFSRERIVITISGNMFIKDEDEKLYTILDYISEKDSREKVIETLIEVALKRQNDAEIAVAYSTAISYYFVINDFKNFEKYLLAVLKYGNNNSFFTSNFGGAVTSITVSSPREFTRFYRDEPEYVLKAKSYVTKAKIWLAHAVLTKKQEKKGNKLNDDILVGLKAGFSEFYKFYIASDKDVIRKFNVVSGILTRDKRHSFLTSTESRYYSSFEQYTILSNDAFMDHLEYSDELLYKFIISFENSYYPEYRKKLKEMFTQEEYKDRMFELVAKYLINNFDNKRSNSTLRRFLRGFQDILRTFDMEDELIPFLGTVPSNISTEILKQQIID